MPAMVGLKNRINGAQLLYQPYVNTDVLPTLLEIAGGQKDTTFDGISLTSVLLDNETPQQDIFWQFSNQKAFRRGNWKMLDDQLYDLSLDPSEQTDLSG